MTSVLIAGAVWLVVSVLAALLIGYSIRLADRQDPLRLAAEGAPANFVVDATTDMSVPDGNPSPRSVGPR